ncbi:PP2C family protein-serine/threonine phosphatase [Halocola ammonii]
MLFKSLYISAVTRSGSGRIALIVMVGMVLLAGYFIAHSYLTSISTIQYHQLDKLYTIARTAAAQIDGDDVEYLMNAHTSKDEISRNDEDFTYHLLHQKLRRSYETNMLESPVYTLYKDPASDRIFFGVTSSENPYFRHEYHSKPDAILENYKSGGTIDRYKDENGTWLSAFAPIKNSAGEVVSILQVDEPFDSFLVKARQDLYWNIAISVIVFLIIGFVMLNLLVRVLKKEDLIKEKLSIKNEIIEAKNNDITASINYARKLQLAFKVNEREMQKYFSDFFLINLPKDIITGDFFWFHCNEETGEKIAILADCTGHGVPGAMMSILGHSLLDEIVIQNGLRSVDLIMKELNCRLIALLNKTGQTVRDGMDISILNMDKNGKVSFCGANHSIVKLTGGEAEVVRSNRFAIGEIPEEVQVEVSNFELEKGDVLYLYSDGFRDQFGGPCDKKFMSRQFYEMLASCTDCSLRNQKKKFLEIFKKWKGDSEQVDDVSLVGIKV